MIKKFDIWKSDFSMEDYKDYIEELKGENPDYSHEDLYHILYHMHQEYLEDERRNLDVQLKNPILVIGDLGLWNGRASGYKSIESGNIKDIFSCSDDYVHWYCDGYNICCTGHHHDGTNFYTYREIRDNVCIENFLSHICEGTKITSALLNYYTRSIAKDVGRVYGICK